jgi:threonylcarbamoyladenosine tRNA methylthiotransferase MtaB
MVYIVTYGCKVNHYESVQVRSLLNSAGVGCELIAEKDITKIKGDAPPLDTVCGKREVFTATPCSAAAAGRVLGGSCKTSKGSGYGAPVFVVNSCAVTGMAEKKSRYGTAKIKKYFPNAEVFSMGCAFDRKTPATVAAEILGRKVDGGVVMHKRRKAFIKVQDGCRNFCSFCIIPYKRTKLHNTPAADVVAEINAQPDFVTEIIISGINLCYYDDIAGLCSSVDGCGRAWYLSSLEPQIITPEFVAVLCGCRHFKPEFHICLQSGSDKVLREMNRRYTCAEYLGKVNTVRKSFPNARISTDIIVGYPTETDADFNATVEFVRAVKFDAVHIFPYSPRAGTAAAELKPLTNSLVTKRFNTLKALCSGGGARA